MKLFSFTNYDHVEVTIPLTQVESIRFPSGRVHDMGGVTLVSGRVINFCCDGTAQKLKATLEEAES